MSTRKLPLHLLVSSWKNNPSNWPQRLYICFIAAIATIASIYMGLYQWRLIAYAWDPIFGSQTMQVLDSDVSHKMTEWFRLPDAICGALAYLTDIIFGLAGSHNRWYERPWLVTLFGIAVIPFAIVSTILVGMQGFVVGAFCFLCLVTAVVSLALVFLAYGEVYACFLLLYRIWQRTRNWKLLWKIFWGEAHPITYEIAKEILTPKK